MPLKGIKVIEFVGLAPAPFCGKILSDFGATVTRIDKTYENALDSLADGKRTLAVNLKTSEGPKLIKALCQQYDILIDPFRPGVLEKLKLGPNEIMKDNSKLIYARLTGFGQDGPLSTRAGHDLNYIAISGVLSFLGRKNENPTAPVNLLADFAGGGLLCALGICLALLERVKSGKGQIVDSSMVEGAAYIASWLIRSQNLPIWGYPRGENTLDTGSFYYDTYKTKDGKFMSVAALEPQFYNKFINGIGLPELQQFSSNSNNKQIVAEKFASKTQKEWSEIFEGVDACVFPVLEWNEAWKHEHNRSRKTFHKNENGDIFPKPAPRLNRTPGKLSFSQNNKTPYQMTMEILSEIGKSEKEIYKLCNEKIVLIPNMSKL